MNINGKNFVLKGDPIEQITMADSFVRKNKIHTGHGEARLYLGPQGAIDYSDFFGDYNNRCVILKSDLLEYMKDAAEEYKAQDQGYQHDISSSWSEYINEIKSLQSDIVFFDVHAQNGEDDKSRYYIGSNDYIFTLLRDIALPKISYLAILPMTNGSENINYFKLFMDYEYKTVNHPQIIKKAVHDIENNQKIEELTRKQLVNSRIGQGKFRDGVLKQISACPITNVNDERLLIASHIKPWVTSDNQEKLDPYNGIMLTPTYDKLFNDGYITFSNEGIVMLSPYISPFNMAKMQLSNGKKYQIHPEGREKYLQYHRENIYKK